MKATLKDGTLTLEITDTLESANMLAALIMTVCNGQKIMVEMLSLAIKTMPLETIHTMLDDLVKAKPNKKVLCDLIKVMTAELEAKRLKAGFPHTSDIFIPKRETFPPSSPQN